MIRLNKEQKQKTIEVLVESIYNMNLENSGD